jgi:hypothetical protein
MKFRYLVAAGLLDTSGKMVKRPVVMLELKTVGGQILEVPAWIDSGADRTMVNMEYAEQLGITLGKSQLARGIGRGTAETKIAHLPFKIKSTDIELDVPASYIDSENVTILLGQEVFFDHFRIIFDKSKETFELIRVNKD